MSEHRFTNSLIHETSPYLLQHAHNPVNWLAWNDATLQKAKQENKPILVSIGYSACHWCHVMERESFEDEETAAIMNEHFINIKIDREERPDIDHIYMEAVQAITGSGGWPLNVFLTPGLKPFYGGTYFPPVDAFNRASWKKTLLAVSNAFKIKRTEIEEQAAGLLEYLKNANNINNSNQSDLFSFETTEKIAAAYLQNADTDWGGFGKAPKFPQTFIITYLLQYYHFTKNEAALQQALLSLDKMMMGGIYDHVGGGFARYSTDTYWKAPHFEKMLYDNALLLSAYSEAFAITKNKKYETVISETVSWLEREMLSEQGGFYSALDADSESVEGKFYIWSKEEIKDILGTDAEWFSELFNVTEEGNWEGSNILWMPATIQNISENFKMTEPELADKLNICKKLLLKERSKRIRPALDDKILLGWNCLMISALCSCYAFTGQLRYKKLAETNMLFIKSNFKNEDGSFAHSFKKHRSVQEAFLDDYAAFAKACIDLSEINGDNQLLQTAKAIAEKVLLYFGDGEQAFLFFTPSYQPDVIIKKKEMYDGATPSGNSLMALVLHKLSILLDVPEWKARSMQMLQQAADLLTQYPQSFGCWTIHLQKIITGFKEIAIAGNDFLNILPSVLELYLPERVIQSGAGNQDEFPLLRNRLSERQTETFIYLCLNYTCKQPVKDIQSFRNLIGY